MMTRSGAGVAETTRLLTPGVTQMRPKATTPENGDAVLRYRARNRAFIDEVNARTTCAYCGAQPVEWHNPEHVLLNRQNWRIGNLVRQPASIAAIKSELARCTPLCRRCHMREDGRMSNLKSGGTTCPPKPCSECSRLFKPLRKGLCERCYDTGRRRAQGAQPLGTPFTHCRKGHALVEGNILIDHDGSRRCKTCRRASQSGGTR